MITTTLRLPEEMHETLTDMAAKNRRSFNSEVLWIFEEAIKSLPPEKQNGNHRESN